MPSDRGVQYDELTNTFILRGVAYALRENGDPMSWAVYAAGDGPHGPTIATGELADGGGAYVGAPIEPRYGLTYADAMAIFSCWEKVMRAHGKWPVA